MKKKEFENINSFLDENYLKNHKILEEEYGFDKTLIKKLYVYLNPENINEAFNMLTKINNKYQHYFYSHNGNNNCLICNEKKENHMNKEKDYYCEKYIYKKEEPISFNEVIRYKKKEKAMCKIIGNKDIATGFFCKINFKDMILKALFTNNHVLDKEKIKRGIKIKIEHDNRIKDIIINNNRFVCTNAYLDYTCIQIFDYDMFDTFFEIDNKINCNNPYEEYKNDKFVIIQYPEGKEISFSEGYIGNIVDDSITYTISTKHGSSGSPIIISTRNLNVIGIHCGGKKTENLNRGTYFKPILEDIEKNIKNSKQIQFDNITYNNKIKPLNQFNLETKKYDAFSKQQFEQNYYNW